MQGHIVKAFDAEVENLNKKIAAMAKACEEQLSRAIKSFSHLDTHLAGTVIKDDSHINKFQKEIEDESVRLLTKRQPMAADLRHLLSVIKIASELERIGDYAANIAKRVTKISDNSFKEPVDLIIEMANICGQMINDAIDAFLDFDIEKSIAIWHRDDEIDEKFARMMTLTRKQMQDKNDSVENCTQLIFMGKCCERIGDHITNIAEDIYYMVTGENYTGIA